MSIPETEWLAQAKRCAINQSRRVQHNQESGADMSVGNKGDRYWSYCHRCHEGGVSMKTHVVLSNRAPPESTNLTIPTDLVHVLTAEPHIQHGVGTFLASKNMDLEYLPNETYFSESRKRLMIDVRGQWMGRDTTGKSAQKWLTYNRQSFVAAPSGLYSHNKLAILTEDLFSMYKVAHAIRETSVHHNTAVFCTLGTKINPPLFLRLIQEFSKVLSFYDGDQAGWHGCDANSKRLKALGLGLPTYAVTAQCAPSGQDPKDMGLEAIRQHINQSLGTRGY